MNQRFRARFSACLLSGVVVAAPLLAAGTPAWARSGPRLDVARTWHFTLGAQVPQAVVPYSTPDTYLMHAGVPVQLDWRARSSVGIDHVDVSVHLPGGTDPVTVLPVLTGTTASSWLTTRPDTWAFPGGGNAKGPKTYRVTAVDTRGASTTVDGIVLDRVHSEQQDGATYSGVEDGFPAHPTATSTWQQVTGADLDEGSALQTTTRGARIDVPVSTRAQQVFAVEASTGPGHGRFDVLVDGVKVGSANTAGTTDRQRILVFQYALTAGTHTVSVVSAGRPSGSTVTVDGFFLSD